jgi:flotillin
MNNSKFTNLIAPALIFSAPFIHTPAVNAQVNMMQPVPIVATQPVQNQNSADPNLVYTLIKAGLVVGGTGGLVFLLSAFMFRRVVSTNVVHIVQSGKNTVPYGAKLEAGNVYYDIPTWIPKLGVSVIKLPVNNFDLSLNDYEAYDEDRVPFVVDVTAFFRIYDTTIAAQRILNIDELQHQLSLIVQGAVRKVLASDNIHTIMLQRATFGESFSNEVKEQLAEWGVQSIKNMELMDIRDSHKSDVIARIQAKKISEIDRDSRMTVAENNRIAKVAEVENLRTSEISSVDANREIQLSREIAEQQVGERSAAKQKAVGVAQEQSKQEVLLEQARTMEKDLAVRRVEEVKVAEIERDTALVLAEKEQKVAAITKQTALVQASQTKETTILVAEGNLEAEKNKAAAIQATGIAKAEAEKALQLAPVSAQITLAQEIGTNESYQKYLALIEAFKAYIAVGSEQAKSLQNADVKIIANGGSASDGVTKVMDIFSSKGGTSIAAAVEAIAQSDIGSDLLNRLTNKAE